MPNQTFDFKQFSIKQDHCAMKVGTDAVLLGAWANTSNTAAILDIGTGTGVIALMLAQRCSARIDAIDVDEEAYLQATENIANSKWKERIFTHLTSLQDYSLNAPVKYDLIVSNPPYFEDSTKALQVTRTLARHNDFLPFDELLKGAVNLLQPAGKFCVILPFKEGEQFRTLAEQNKLYLTQLMRIKTRADKLTEKRWLMQFELLRNKFSETTLVIENDERHSYTEEYKQLTKDYYQAF
jgi:tRNA1Val (adenine37-N6)-methyltransferase